MIRKEAGETVVTCDRCGARQHAGVRDEFQAFWRLVRDHGWRPQKQGHVWLHVCPDCREGLP